MQIETLRFLNEDQVRDVAATQGTPAYVYDEAGLRAHAADCLAFPNAFGLTVRYAMKANPHRRILRIFHEMGLHIDASSGHEARRAMAAGIPAQHISLSSQELPADLGELMDAGVLVNATSLGQIRAVGALRPGATIGLRFNPGLGTGGTQRTNVGGPGSAFGIWHVYAGEAQALLKEFGLRCTRIHTHIGSGGDPAVWQRVSHLSLELVKRFPDVDTLDLGGGFKVGRMAHEKTTDLQVVGTPVRDAFEDFARETGRQLRLEIEPGTFLAANNGAIVSTIQDIVDTGDEGYTFYRTDTGMTDVLRPSLYGAQHPLVVVPRDSDTERKAHEVIVVGHCCESGDILTPAPGDSEALSPRLMHRAAVGDYLVVEGAGAYCAAMATKHYNSFPASAEMLLQADGTLVLIRPRQAAEALWLDEC